MEIYQVDPGLQKPSNTASTTSFRHLLPSFRKNEYAHCEHRDITPQNGQRGYQIHSLIRTPSRRAIQTRSKVNPQRLALTHIPSGHILPLHAGGAPRQRITLVRKGAERDLAARGGNRQNRRRRARPLAYVGIELSAFGVDQFDQLAFCDLELAGCACIGEDGAAWRRVQWRVLQVLVVVCSCDSADPGVATLKG